MLLKTIITCVKFIVNHPNGHFYKREDNVPFFRVNSVVKRV